MDFKDWRKPADTNTNETKPEKPKQIGKYRGKRYYDYIEEQIRDAQERGEFDNLPGSGKPLNLDIESNPYVGEKTLGYRMLKSNGFAPAEIELSNEISREFARAEARLARLRHRSRSLRTRRIRPFPSEKQAFNAAVEQAASEYEQTLRELNRKILTLNLTAPPAMHKPLLPVEQLVQQFTESCPTL